MATVKRILKWLGTHFKIAALIVSAILFSIFILWWGRKNRKIRGLEQQLAVTKAKLSIERLEVKYNTDIEDLKKLKEKDKDIQKDIEKIEESLEKKLKPEMSAEEIANKFKEIGL
jgi:hypothetical protein